MHHMTHALITAAGILSLIIIVVIATWNSPRL
jgi:uncharacterized membrane protein YqjE